MTKFAEIPWFIVEEYLNKISSYNAPNEYSSHSSGGSYLTGPHNLFITVNTDPMNLFAKNEESDYKDLRLNVVGNWKKSDNEIIFKRLFTREIEPSDEVKRTVEEDGYRQVTYDYFVGEEDNYKYDIEPEDKIYTRKDSLFREWIEKNWDRFEGFVNKEKPFLYLGTGYKTDDYIKIYHWTWRDWVKRTIPRHMRNDNLDEFIDSYFDKFAWFAYNKNKNLINLIDAFETEEPFIDNLIDHYATEPLSLELDEFKKRIFVDNLIYWLKKKGTYSSIFIIWNILSRDTKNNLVVYDRWHDPIESGSPLPYFEDYDYTDYYDPSSNYPTNYDVENGKVLSTHYKVSFDMSTNPFKDGYVLPKELTEDLYEKWEELRPVTRVSHYESSLNLKSDLSGLETELYDDPIYDANIYSSTTLFSEAISGAAIFVKTTPSKTWSFDHMLGTQNVIIDTYDVDLRRIYAEQIRIVSNNRVEAVFPEPITGTILVLESDYTRTQDTILDNWTINHLLNSKYVVPQFHSESEVVIVDKIEAQDEDNLYAETEGLSGTAQIGRTTETHIQSTASKEWEIVHNLGYLGVIIDIYDENDQIMKPLSVNLKDENTSIINFEEPVTGYAGLRPVGNPRIGGDVSSRFNGTWKFVVGDGVDTLDWDYNLENDVKSPKWEFYFDETNVMDYDDRFEFNITIPKSYSGYMTEFGIFDIEDNLSFYSRGDYIYKHGEMDFSILYVAYKENLT